MSYTYSNRASSSRSSNVYAFERSPTPPRIRSGSPMGRTFPQSLPPSHHSNYLQNSETKLRDYDGKPFVYLQDLEIMDSNLEGMNSAQFVNLNGNQYIFKRNFVQTKFLPENSMRQTHYIDSDNLNDDEQEGYHSNSRTMMQIMSRDLLKLFAGHKKDIILPKMYPVVNKKNGEIYGIISEKIDFKEAINLDGLEDEQYDQASEYNQNLEKEIREKFTNDNIIVLVEILGIQDIIVEEEIKNVGLTEDKKLVFFDFGVNLLDYEYYDRHKEIDISRPSYENGSFETTPQDLVNHYLDGYGTDNNPDTGLAETINPDIYKIIMNSGPGDKDFRKHIAKILQTRINMVIEDTKK